MTNTFVIPKQLVIFGVVIPLAVVVGYFLATPDAFDTMVLIGLVLSILSIPILLRWHHPMLVFSWNTGIIVFFLPGQPNLWMLLALISLFLTMLTRILNKEIRVLNVPSVTWALLFMALVVLVTAKVNGGIGLRSLGGDIYGGKKYVFVLFAVAGYFALSAQRIPLEKAHFYTSLFLLSGLTLGFSNLVYLAGPNFWFLYNFFPVDYALTQAYEDLSSAVGAVRFSRLASLPWVGLAFVSYMLMRFGVRGIFDLTKPWRLIAVLILIGVSLLGGLRSIVVIFGLLFLAQFYFEGLFRTRLFPALVLAGVLLSAVLLPFVTKLSLSVQRSLSVLPIPVDPLARADADSSSEWRLKMWRLLLPEIPRYFWIGKGYTASPTDYYLAQESIRRGLAEDIEMSLIAGDYHNGPLSVIIPFGIWGVLAFVAFIAAALRVLYHNYRYGDPALRNINTFLLCIFIARLVFYFMVFGAINSDMPLFAGWVALSVALNGGMRRASDLSEGIVTKPKIS